MVPIDHVDIAASHQPDAIAIVEGPLRLTYRELMSMSRRVAAAIARHADGDDPVPCVLYAENSHRFLVAKLGVMRAGGVVVPLHAKNTAEVSLPFLRATQPRCLFYDRARAGEVRRIKVAVPSLRTCICLDGPMEGDPTLDDLLTLPDDYAPAWIDVNGNPDRPVYYWATSGTTGEPRAVIETMRNFDATLRMTTARRAAQRNVMLALAPFTHGGGPASLGTFFVGGTVVIPTGFKPAHILSAIDSEGVTDMWLTPTALYMLLDWPELGRYNLRTLRTVLLGAAAISASRLKQAVEVLGPCLSHSYGQIETGFVTILGPDVVAAAASGVDAHRLQSSGSTTRLNRFAIMGDDERLLGPGEQGEIVVRGAGVKRYIDPAVTAATQRGGWHHTGDLGYVDRDGFLYVVGRLKDVVNMAGFKIPAAEVERVIMEIPAVAECAVVAVPDPTRGEAIQAVVTVRPGHELSPRAVVKHCVARLGIGKAPHRIEEWPELPRSSAGKINKHVVRQRVIEAISAADARGALVVH